MSKKPSQVLVAIDSQTLAWCVVREGVTKPSKDELQRAEWLMDELEEMNARIIIPAIVVSEYLVPIPENRHAATIAAISKRFIIAPFDARCSSLAAKLFAVGKPMRTPNIPMGRECLRSDTMIIATAKVHSAKLFYTDDKDCREVAKTVLDARALPINSKSLFPVIKAKKTKKS